MKSTIVSIATLLLAPPLAGCVHSYVKQPPLPYAQLAYESVDGQQWPEKYIEIPRTAERFGLKPETKICYIELNPEGKTPLVFIHGLGSYLKFWRHQLDEFASAGFRVIAVDLPGYGKSDKPAGYPYTMEAMADTVRELAEAVGAERPVLVGHSMGGQTALSYAIRYPEALRALVLTAPAGFEKFSRREKEWFRSVFTSTLIKSTSERGIWGSIRRNNFFRWRPEFEWLIEERVRTAKNGQFDRYAYANVKSVQGLTQTDFIRANLGKIRVPTLIIHGDRDRLIPNPFMHGGRTRDLMAWGSERIDGSKLVTLEDCGHMLQMDCAAPYNEEVSRFLRDALTDTDTYAERP